MKQEQICDAVRRRYADVAERPVGRFTYPVRLRLLNLLAEGEVCVGHLHEALDLPQSAVSRHPAYLRKRGLVLGRKEGLWVHYRPAKPAGELHRNLIGCFGACFKEIDALKQDRQKLDHGSCC